MRSEEFDGCNALLGPPSDERGQPVQTISPLPVRTTEDGFVSQWRPSKHEIGMIVRGSPIRLYILGPAHPPVMLEVVNEALLPAPNA